MMRRRRFIVCTAILLLLCIAPVSNAAYFVFQKRGNIRSGPGTKYRIIGQLSEGTITQVPSGFEDYDAKWVPIDEETKYDQKTKSTNVVYSKWVHRSLGAVVRGDAGDVEKYLAIIESGWSQKMQELILAEKLEIGMTTHMVFYSWGKPDAINESPSSDAPVEEWIYKRRGDRKRHLYFEKGLLVEIE